MKELKESLKILVVDDDDLICQTLNDIFEEKGYYVEVATNGQIAKEKTNQIPFAIFLIDLKLPDTNGIDLIKDLKEIRPSGIYFIVTGYSSIQNVSKAIKDGVDGYFVKPLVIEEIEKRIMDLSEKREIQIQLENSEQKYRLISENVNDLIVVINDKIEVEYVNEIALKNMFGYSRDEVIGRSGFDFINIDGYEPTIEGLNKAYSESDGALEFKAHHKDGHEIWIATLGKSFINEKAEPKTLLVIREITKRKSIELKLKESEIKYRHLFENSPFINTLIDTSGTVVDINSLMLKKYGYQKADFLNKNFSEFKNFPSETYSTLKNIFKEVFKKGQSEPKEILFFNKNGSKTWVSIQANLIQIGGANYIQAITQDINKSKEDEQKLEESENRFRTITEQSFMGIIIVQNSVVIYANKKATNILELSLNELAQLPKYEIFNILNLPKEFGISQNPLISFKFSTKINKISTKTKWIELYMKSVNFKGKSADLITLLDITKKKEAEKIILEENKKLLELNKLKDELNIRISHELKTPLNSICSASRLLLKILNNKIGEEAQELLELIEKGGDRLEKLVIDLLNVSKIESDQFYLNINTVNIGELIRESIVDVSPLLEEREQVLNVENIQDLTINIDRERIKETVENLLINSIKNTPLKGTITIKLKEFNLFIEIQISDTGIGFTNKEKERVFTKFGKIERYGQGFEINTEGSGLGLYLSKKYVKKHGGKLLLESDGRNRGSTFFIRLPKIP